MEQLTQKLGQFAVVTSTNYAAANQGTPSKPQTSGWEYLDDFVQNIALRNGKMVRLVTSGLSEIELDEQRQQTLKDICIQLLRNAVVHGIEPARDRELSQKPAIGRIDLRLARISATEMELTVMDDGQGLDYNAIRIKALNSGKWPEAEIESWSNKQLLGLIFQQGFSTAAEINKDAGRGVGMELVMNHVLAQRGKLSVSSSSGRHCRFVITLPIPQHNLCEDIAA